MKHAPFGMAGLAFLGSVTSEIHSKSGGRRDFFQLRAAAAVAMLLGFSATVDGQVPSLAPEDATPTTHSDVSSFISTGCGYDAWTGSARRVVHDIFPVAGSLAGGGLRLDRTYSSHNDALQPLPDYIYYEPGERHTAMQLSHTWWMTGRNGINDGASDLYIVHFPDGRSVGFHRPEDSGLGETEAWRSGLGTKERLFFYNDPLPGRL